MHHKSPWEIGAAHWNQKDLYTANDRIDDSGYGRGPSVHPEEGSYAYHRDAPPPKSTRADGPSLNEREAWPWLNYQKMDAGPDGWKRADSSIQDEVCETLTHDTALDARDITVSVKEGEVTLEGSVPDEGSKRRAELDCERVRDITKVHNKLSIQKHDDDDLAFTAPLPVV